MKLSKLYSNDPRFKEVSFNKNFNVILGEIKDINDLTRDSHNLGKSTLLYLIDFMLLKEIDKHHFLKKKKEFANHIFFLEVELNSGKYLTIKRGVKHNTKISIKLHNTRHMDYRECNEWDYKNLALNSTDESKNPKGILQKALDFDVLKSESYRKTSGYFFRTQDDYTDIFKLKKHMGTDLQWKPILFQLLGFDSEFMVKKYKLESEINVKEDLVNKINEEFKIDAGEIDKINGLIDIKHEEREKIISWLDEFDFYQKEVDINKYTLEDIETQISKYNTQRYNLDFEIEQINESLKDDREYNLDEVLEIYKEVEIYFPKYLKKNYEELLDFNRRTSIERHKYLSETLEEKTDKRKLIDDKLKELNGRRVDMLGDLKNTNTFEKYNKYRSDLINVERELEKYKLKLENIDNVKGIQKEIASLNKSLSNIKNSLEEQVTEGNKIYKDIRKDFHDYVKYILNQDAMLSIKINSNGNVDFKADFLNDAKEETAQDLGYSYKKILCACFDLAIVKNYVNNSFYKVIYHDGCLESLDPRKRKKYLDLVRKISTENNIQYILTSLKSDIPTEAEYELKESEIAVVLDDTHDNSGRLFGFEF